MEMGYLTLFTNSLLAATILPIGSEPLLIYQLNNGASPMGSLFWASLGNTLGAIINYVIGWYGGRYILEKIWRIKPHRLERAENQLRLYGAPLLLLSWLPVLGDPITIAAGLAKIPLLKFVFLVGLAKTLRYAVVIWGVSGIL